MLLPQAGVGVYAERVFHHCGKRTVALAGRAPAAAQSLLGTLLCGDIQAAGEDVD